MRCISRTRANRDIELKCTYKKIYLLTPMYLLSNRLDLGYNPLDAYIYIHIYICCTIIIPC